MKNKKRKPPYKPKLKDQITLAQIEAALRANGGFHSMAADDLGCSQQNITQRIKRSQRLQKVVKEIEEIKLDFCESKLMENINGGDQASIFFYLKCKGKKRGYIEKKQIEHSTEDNKPISIGINWIGSRK